MPASSSPGGPGGPGGAEGTASLKKKIFFKLAAVFYFLKRMFLKKNYRSLCENLHKLILLITASCTH